MADEDGLDYTVGPIVPGDTSADQATAAAAFLAV
jgi:hypothetical protein